VSVEVLRYSSFRSERHERSLAFFVILSAAKDLDGRSTTGVSYATFSIDEGFADFDCLNGWLTRMV